MPRIALKAIKQQEIEVCRMRRKSTISSVIIALMVVVVLMLVLMLIMLPGISRESPVVIAYSASGMNDEDLSARKNFSHLRAKPASPSSSALSRVISAATASPITVPALDIEVPEPSLTFGSGDDFGDGWGGGGGGEGDGGGGGGFFRQEIKSTRVCFVIDFSQSMKGERDSLMRAELFKSVRNLRLGMQFQMIFFAGPAWVAGSKVEITGGRKAAVVQLGRDSYRWKSPGNASNWSPVGSQQKPEWISAAPHQRNDALRLIGNTPLVWGTNWQNPLMMALSMDPPPQEIFFMTDGAVDGDMMKLARQLGQRATAKGIVINTVAMMEPKAEGALKELAKRTGGQFTVVRKGGKVVPMD